MTIKLGKLCLSIRKIGILGILCVLLGSASCGRQGEANFKSQTPTNGTPVITSASIVPENPNKDSNLEAFVRSQDSDGDAVNYHYQWIKNNEDIQGEDKNILQKGYFKKGDLIQVKVIPSDAKTPGSPFLSGSVKVLNSLPVIQELKIEPKMAYADDQLKADVKSYDIDGDPIDYTYQWEVNGTVLTDENRSVLDRNRFKKGDLIAVIVTPDDRESKGSAKKSEPITILNSPPIIISSPPTSVEGNDYTYQVKAYDPDNEPISFALKTAPKGMTIDNERGLIRWSVQRQDKGTHPVEIEASTKEGGKGYQRFVLSVETR
jgi:hypothetical protein